jgi:hypothetical protein
MATILHQLAKTEKPTGVFWYAFFAEKCLLRHFFGILKKSTSQPARHEAFTKGAKTGPLYDMSAFASGPASGHFLRNSLKINMMALKSAPTERCQKRVTYNNMPFAKPEKRGLFLKRRWVTILVVYWGNKCTFLSPAYCLNDPFVLAFMFRVDARTVSRHF